MSVQSPFCLLKQTLLASASPRRKALLLNAGLDVPVLAADALGAFREPSPEPGESPKHYVCRAAYAKAEVVAHNMPHCVVIGADTIVVLEHSVLGKPSDEEEAVAMLRRLNGKRHRVMTACALFFPREDARPQSAETFVDSTEVIFGDWPDALLVRYAHSGEPLDKAGAYAIQGLGSFLVSGINGSWSTVVGLPVSRLLKKLLERGVIGMA